MIYLEIKYELILKEHKAFVKIVISKFMPNEKRMVLVAPLELIPSGSGTPHLNASLSDIMNVVNTQLHIPLATRQEIEQYMGTQSNNHMFHNTPAYIVEKGRNVHSIEEFNEYMGI